MKVTTWDNTFPGVCRKAARAISEVHVRGVKTNIPFVTNILAHPTFLSGQCHTKFIDETPGAVRHRRTPVTAPPRCCEYIAEIQVANPNAERHQYDIPRFPEARRSRLAPA